MLIATKLPMRLPDILILNLRLPEKTDEVARFLRCGYQTFFKPLYFNSLNDRCGYQKRPMRLPDFFKDRCSYQRRPTRLPEMTDEVTRFYRCSHQIFLSLEISKKPFKYIGL